MQVGFTPKQVIRLTGVPYSTLNLWAKNRFIEPSVSPGTGTGSERVYSFNDLVVLKIAFELRTSGVKTSSLKKVIDFLRRNEHLGKPLSDARLVITGRDVDIVREGELVSLLSKPGQGYLSFVVDVGQLLGELVNIADATQAFAHGILAPSKVETGKKQPKSVRNTPQRKKISK